MRHLFNNKDEFTLKAHLELINISNKLRCNKITNVKVKKDAITFTYFLDDTKLRHVKIKTIRKRCEESHQSGEYSIEIKCFENDECILYHIDDTMYDTLINDIKKNINFIENNIISHCITFYACSLTIILMIYLHNIL